MKIILFLCVAVLLSAAFFAVSYWTRPDHHGHKFKNFPAATVKDLVEKPNEFVKKELTIEGVLTKQCPSTGCWFYLKDSSGKEVKVEMSDAVAKLPDRIGKTAKVEGQLIKYGEDYEFIGSGVEFRK